MLLAPSGAALAKAGGWAGRDRRHARGRHATARLRCLSQQVPRWTHCEKHILLTYIHTYRARFIPEGVADVP
jgi:hypothetical protein